MKSKTVNLKLLGRSIEDLKTISAYLQDSIIIQKDITFLKKNKIFLMLVSRFMWEDAEKGLFRENKRIRCALRFDQVSNVLCKNINQKKKNKVLELLAIKNISMKDQTSKISLIFAGDSIITILVEEIDVLLDDLGEPWMVKKAPKHKI
tara:strand:+ start:135 stop:581 length:447 start_codon:yes stop_codon:yes gene_type:complete